MTISARKIYFKFLKFHKEAVYFPDFLFKCCRYPIIDIQFYIFLRKQLISNYHLRQNLLSQLTKLNSAKLLWSLANGVQYINDKGWKFTGIHLGKLLGLSNHWATLSPKNLEYRTKFEGWSLVLIAYKIVLTLCKVLLH